MIELQHVSYSIPEKDLYRDVNLHIEENAHYAFIGSNGTGKTTLLHMILHPDDYLYEGKIIFSDSLNSSRIGYVSQFSDTDLASDMTVFDYISRPFTELTKKIEDLCDQMASAEDLEPVFEAYQQAIDEKDAVDGDNYETNIKKQLKIADISQLERQSLSSLSGGEFKLIQVIREMLLSPQILFLDEPDVFLDFDHVNALVALLNSHKGTLVVVTHSRYLLNHCFDHIIHLEGCMLQTFEGSYPEYQLKLLSTKAEIEEKAAAEEEEIARQQAIVNKTRALATAIDSASLGKSVHARQTLLDRLQSRRTELPFINIQKPILSFTVDHPIEETDVPAIALQDYEAVFDSQLLENIHLEIMPTDKAAIIGRNGTGKSTIIRDICGENHAGIRLHPELETALFSQVIGSFGSNEAKLEDLLREAGLSTNTQINDALSNIGFSERDRKKNVSQLSGGERDLLQLLIMSLKNANFLLMDEPTGHLDLYAQIALEEALKKYPGGILMVSHDFEIIASCMDYVFYVEDQNIRKMSIRKFRQMVYRNHFRKEDLLLEDQKKTLEVRIEQLLSQNEFEKAGELIRQLETVVEEM